MTQEQVILRIDGRRPPSHQLSYVGRHWSLRARSARDWHQIVQLAIPRTAKPMTGCRIEIHCGMAKKLFDPCNVDMKMLIDGLKRWQMMRAKGGVNPVVENGVIFNDKKKMVRLENRRWILEDDGWPSVKSASSFVFPNDEDSIKILIYGEIL